MKRLATIMALVLCLTTVLVGCGQSGSAQKTDVGKTYKIAFSNPLASLQFQKDLESGMRQAIPEIKEKNGINIEFFSADAKGSVENIVNDVDTFIAEQVDMIIMVNLSPPTTEQIIQNAHSNDIKICVVGQQIGTEELRVGTSDYDGSYNVALDTGNWIKENFNSKGIKGEVLIIAGVSSETMKDRTRGSIDGLNASGCDWTMVTQLEVVQGTADEVLPMVTDAITANPTINTFIGANDNTAMTCYEVAKQAGKAADEYVVAGYGLEIPSIPTFLQEGCAYRFSYSIPSVFGGNIIMHSAVAYLEGLIERDGDNPYNCILPGFVSDTEKISKYYQQDSGGTWMENFDAMTELFRADDRYKTILELAKK